MPVRIRGMSRLITNPAYKKQLAEMEAHIGRYRFELASFGKSVDRRLHGIEMNYVFMFPASEFWTKKGEMSLGLPDVDNCFKVVKDKIFAVIGLSDGLVVSVSGSKVCMPPEDLTGPSIQVGIKRVDLARPPAKCGTKPLQ
jgi:hypothetical protein